MRTQRYESFCSGHSVEFLPPADVPEHVREFEKTVEVGRVNVVSKQAQTENKHSISGLKKRWMPTWKDNKIVGDKGRQRCQGALNKNT